MNKLSRVGIDLAKNVFQLHGVDRHGKAIWRRRSQAAGYDFWLAAVLTLWATFRPSRYSRVGLRCRTGHLQSPRTECACQILMFMTPTN